MVDTHITNSIYSRFLGANLKNNLNWDSHLNTGKCALLPAIRKHLRSSLSQKTKLQLANSFVVSKLLYIICLWGNTNQSQLQKAQVCLNSAAQYVLDARKSTRQANLMEGCNWLQIAELAEYDYLIQLWKVLRWKVPSYMEDQFSLMEEDKIWTKKTRMMLTAEGWRCKTTANWNNLPDYLRAELSLRAFKINLRKLIIERRVTEVEPD